MDPIEEDPLVLLPPDSSSGSDGGDVDGEDIISSLPDSILCHILSKLPTKYVVGTSILSSQWRHLFPSIPNPRIDIDDTHLLHPPAAADGDPHQPVRNTHFINFIHHLLNVALRDVQFSHLSLHFHNDYGNTTIKELVSAASRYPVSHLYLEFTVNDCGISLDDLRNFALLESLALIQKILPKYLHSATFNQSDGLERALNACPLLEDLCLDLCHFPQSEVVRISLPNLKMLLIFNCSYYDSFELEIHTPILEYFNYSDAVAGGYSLVDFSSLLRAHIELGLSNERFEEEDDHSVYSENVAQMIRACYNVTHLYLARTSISNSYNVIHPLPIYHNLIELSLGNLCGTGWELLPQLLQNSPNLEALIFEKGIEDHKGCYSRFESCLPESVPNCLSSHLLKIRFEEFKGEEDELKLVAYFLRTAAVLIEMRVCLLLTLPTEELKRIWSSVKAIPRRSRKCGLHYM